MPVVRTGSSSSSSSRYAPYGLFTHAIPPSLPPTYGVTDLFDWSNPQDPAILSSESSTQLSASKWLSQFEQRPLRGSARSESPPTQPRPVQELGAAPSVLSISSGATSPKRSGSFVVELPLPAYSSPSPSVPDVSVLEHRVTLCPPSSVSRPISTTQPALALPTAKTVLSSEPVPVAAPISGANTLGGTPSASVQLSAMAYNLTAPTSRVPQVVSRSDPVPIEAPLLQPSTIATTSLPETPNRKANHRDRSEPLKPSQDERKRISNSQVPAKLGGSGRRRQVVESDSEQSGGGARTPTPKRALSGSNISSRQQITSFSDSSGGSSEDSGSDSSSGSEGDSDAITATSGTDEDELDDSEEEYESEGSNGSKRPRVQSNRFIDDSARESKPKKKKARNATTVALEDEGRWIGKDRGAVKIRKLASNVPCTWTYSGDGVSRQPLSNRNIADIHFSPGWSGTKGYNYWICVFSQPLSANGSTPAPTLRWSEVAEGQPHPVLKGYVLKPASRDCPPCWVKAQSYRAHNHRKNQPQ
ncbi:hypothetical protein RSOL_522580 [Rhizoctonia solani AG-3 Rhs1AP]|uniref:Uncharacterized protein n=2 Tax=Rhizoctonia solani AG-3 TaxID=1086053 RepID=A0A074RPR8_9AGAM|nr:hypothetical protein RSOL_522580 [Rhizoctonia solani AG-3 Rhs1AP]KEP46663.1 hypothetical protein V565_186970 [Rhizoctonia solani 123E]